MFLLNLSPNLINSGPIREGFVLFLVAEANFYFSTSPLKECSSLLVVDLIVRKKVFL